MQIENIITSFSGTRVLVIGDVMIDAYLWGAVERISPEAPVPVVNITRKEDRLGGAANVALNLLSLGAVPLICSVVGKDRKGEAFCALMRGLGMSTRGILESDARITTVKTRVISHSQQMLRVDEEQSDDLNAQDEKDFFEIISGLIQTEKPEVIVFEDYNKGVLTASLIGKVIAIAAKNNIPTCVDPKKKNFFAYKNVTLFKPNLKELKEGLKIELDRKIDAQIIAAVQEMEKELGNRISLITLSERGVMIKEGERTQFFPAHIRNIADVSGAGDTVIAVAALGLAKQLDVEYLARLANLAGGLVCEKVGVVPVDREQLIEEAKRELIR